jgi:transposase
MSKKHKTYTTEFKAEAIKLIEANQAMSQTALLHKPICKGFFSDIIFK